MMRFQNPFRKGQTGMMLLLILNTVVLAVLYFALPSVLHFAYLPVIYLAVGALLMLWFVFYNKGFTRRNTKVQNLPQGMTEEEKKAWFEEGERLFRKSRWVLTIVIPILLIFLADLLYLFFGQTVIGWFQ